MSDTLYCQSYDVSRDQPCHQPLGTLNEGQGGKQVTTLEGVTVTSLADGGFYINCPACGKGYFWNQALCVPVENVAKMLEAAKLMGWHFIRFNWRSNHRT